MPPKKGKEAMPAGFMVRVSKETHENIRRFCWATGITRSALIQAALEDYFKSRGEKLKQMELLGKELGFKGGGD